MTDFTLDHLTQYVKENTEELLDYSLERLKYTARQAVGFPVDVAATRASQAREVAEAAAEELLETLTFGRTNDVLRLKPKNTYRTANGGYFRPINGAQAKGFLQHNLDQERPWKLNNETAWRRSLMDTDQQPVNTKLLESIQRSALKYAEALRSYNEKFDNGRFDDARIHFRNTHVECKDLVTYAYILSARSYGVPICFLRGKYYVCSHFYRTTDDFLRALRNTPPKSYVGLSFSVPWKSVRPGDIFCYRGHVPMFRMRSGPNEKQTLRTIEGHSHETGEISIHNRSVAWLKKNAFVGELIRQTPSRLRLDRMIGLSPNVGAEALQALAWDVQGIRKASSQKPWVPMIQISSRRRSRKGGDVFDLADEVEKYLVA